MLNSLAAALILFLPICVVIVSKFIYMLLFPNKPKSSNKIVCFQSWILYLFVFVASAMLLGLIGSIEKGLIGHIILFGLTEIGSWLILIAKLNYKISYSDENFTYRNFFRKRYQYKYEEIISLKIKNAYAIIEVVNKKFTVSFYFTKGTVEFLKLAMSRKESFIKTQINNKNKNKKRQRKKRKQ